MISADKLSHADQIATAVESTVSTGDSAGSRAIDMRVWDGIDVRLLPDRGLDIGTAWFRGTPLAWVSENGEQGAVAAEGLVDNLAWGAAWSGGLMTTCGLSNVGVAAEGIGLHGTYTARRADDVKVERSASELTVTAVIVDPPFTVSRRISTALGQGLVRLDDRTVNESEWTAAAPLLYHVNLGAPVWDDDAYLETDSLEVIPRDEIAASGIATWDEPPPASKDEPELVFEHVGATWARLTSPRLGVEVTVRSSLPRLWQWLAPATGRYALGLEPANCSVLGREHDIAIGRMPFLDPGEVRESWLTIEARSI